MPLPFPSAQPEPTGSDSLVTAGGTSTAPSWLRLAASQEWAAALLYLALDMVVWVAISAAAGYLRTEHLQGAQLQLGTIGFIQLSVAIGVLFVIGGYHRHTNMRGLDYTTQHVLGMVVAAALSFLLIYSAATFDQSMKPSRGVILASFLAFAPLSIAYRRALYKTVTSSTAKRYFLVIGSGELAREFYLTYRSSPRPQQLRFVDCDDFRAGQHLDGPESPLIESDCEGKLEALDHRCSGVILTEGLERVPSHLRDRLVRTQFQRSRVYTLEAFFETHWRYVPVEMIDPYWALQTGFQLSRTSPYHYLKRLLDVVLAGLLLIVSAPVIAIVALVVRASDGAPALFRQERIGVDNEPFTLYKFRTMKQRAASGEEDIYTRANDPRITRVGGWLRKLRLDELPQLWNVLRGDMSLIGPRAEWIRCTERYEKHIPFYHFRHLVKPGITGWAQVNYPYGESEEDAIEKLKYDLYYIRHYSIKLDAMIVLKTAETMLFGRGR